MVNCVTKGTKSDIVIGRNPHLNDLQYTTRAVAIRFIVGYSSNMCRYSDDTSVGGNGCGCRRSGDGSGDHIKGSNRRGHARLFPPWRWWGSLIKCCGGRALMDVSVILLSLYLLDTICHCVICDRIQDNLLKNISIWLNYIELRTRLNQFEMFVSFLIHKKNIENCMF